MVRMSAAAELAAAYKKVFPEAKELPASPKELQRQLEAARVRAMTAAANVAAVSGQLLWQGTGGYEALRAEASALLARGPSSASEAGRQEAAKLTGRGDPNAVFRGVTRAKAKRTPARRA